MHPFSDKDFVQSLLKQFHGAKGVLDKLVTEKTSQDLAQEFNTYVNDRRCLIVLNDLSTIEEWDQIKNCFRNNKKGSRIIVSNITCRSCKLMCRAAKPNLRAKAVIC